ncbi:hypothetical protein MRB53_015729 [Persea americana]|uniref:Uncharacterized protein n=1 Tax=Persea americana TaxID=3435 RepID=A0ACC2M042_PERAE|nr:hypothetical protein MRB53_015729 [Persea americana]
MDDHPMYMDQSDARPVDASMRDAVAALEHHLGYRFRNPNLLVDALTHTSYPEGATYERLEFVGDAVLGLAISYHLYLAYPHLDPCKLSVLRAANGTTEKFARVAVRHDLYQYLRRNSPTLDEKVKEFADSIRGEVDEVYYTGAVKAPKVLADIVEGIAAAVFVDCNLSLEILWMVFRRLLEPMVTLETLQRPPVTTLFEFCRQQGKQLDIRYWKEGSKSIASVYVDRVLLGSGSSKHKETAKLYAVQEALPGLLASTPRDMETDKAMEQGGSKMRLNQLCTKNRWPNPRYRVEKELGPGHDKQFMCSVQVDTLAGIFESTGDSKSKVKDSENSAAFVMLNLLQEMGHGCSD